jgi:hypothetical protein
MRRIPTRSQGSSSLEYSPAGINGRRARTLKGCPSESLRYNHSSPSRRTPPYSRVNVRTPPLQDRVTAPSLRLVRRFPAAPESSSALSRCSGPLTLQGSRGPGGPAADGLIRGSVAMAASPNPIRPVIAYRPARTYSNSRMQNGLAVPGVGGRLLSTSTAPVTPALLGPTRPAGCLRIHASFSAKSLLQSIPQQMTQNRFTSGPHFPSRKASTTIGYIS